MTIQKCSKFIGGIVLLFAFVSCGGLPPEKQLASVKVLEKKDLEQCMVMEAIQTVDQNGSEALAINEAKFMVLKKGGNAIHIEDSIANGKEVVIKAFIYKCS